MVICAGVLLLCENARSRRCAYDVVNTFSPVAMIGYFEMESSVSELAEYSVATIHRVPLTLDTASVIEGHLFRSGVYTEFRQSSSLISDLVVQPFE